MSEAQAHRMKRAGRGRIGRWTAMAALCAASLMLVAPPRAAAQAQPPAKAPATAETAPAPGGPPATPASAKPPAANTPAAAPQGLNVAAANIVLTKLQNQLPTTTNDAQLAAMGQQAAVIDSAVDRALAAQRLALTGVETSLRRLPVRRHQPASEQRKRAMLQAAETSILAQVAQTEALAVRADQVFSQIAERRREGFSARVLEQTPSPIAPDFWTSLAHETGADLSRLAWLALGLWRAAQNALEPRGLGGLAAGVVAAVLLALPVRRVLTHLGWRRARPLPSSGARRTLAIFWRTLVDVAMATLAAAAVRLGAQWGGLLTPAADQLAGAAVGSVAWAAAVVSLGRALATARESGQRLLRIADSEADRARVSLWIVALITACGFFVQKLNYVVGASVAATIATNCVISLAYAGAAFLILASFGRPDAPKPAGEAAAAAASGIDAARSPAWTLISLALAGAIVATVGAVLLGYTTLAALIAGQIFWLSLLGAVMFLALRLVDDLFGALFRERGRASTVLHQLFGLKTSTVLQVGLLVSAALQVLIILVAVVLALTPFGQSGQMLVTHLRQIGADVQIGKVIISPVAVGGGLVTFFVGVGLSHLVRSWVERRYLPVTHWDAGVRNSVTTGVGYLGVAISLICALAVTGVGLQQIALVASALSVGIGFGLQQIVQNFVAGIILLIERPVKVGDWVNVGGVEGDVLDIRVRATDIRSPDGSTVIVPNSSLITTNVQNKTMGGLHSRIQLQVTVAKPADVAKARDVILSLADGRPDILKKPPPQVLIDAIVAGGGANLNASLYVTDPRAATRVRSELYFALLDAFQKNEIAM